MDYIKRKEKCDERKYQIKNLLRKMEIAELPFRNAMNYLKTRGYTAQPYGSYKGQDNLGEKFSVRSIRYSFLSITRKGSNCMKRHKNSLSKMLKMYLPQLFLSTYLASLLLNSTSAT